MSEEENRKTEKDNEHQLSEFRRRLSEKYEAVFDEPMPDRLVELILRLREIKQN